MGQSVVDAIDLELALDAVAGTAHAGALMIAALDHEARDNAVEDQAVIEALVCQRDEVAHGLGRDLGIQLCDDLAAVLHFDRNDRILCHKKPS